MSRSRSLWSATTLVLTSLFLNACVASTSTPVVLPTAATNSYESRIPDLEIPDDLFFSDKGRANFDPIAGRVLYTKGDWILYGDTLESILPIPKGWTTRETGQLTYILYSPTGDLEQPTIRIRLSIRGYEDDSTISEDVVSEFVKANSELPTVSLLTKEIVDADKGYVFGEVKTESGKKRYLLQVFSKYAKNPSGKFFHVFSVFTYQEDWKAYYPIIRAMVKNWTALDNTPIGVPLPDTLIK